MGPLDQKRLCLRLVTALGTTLLAGAYHVWAQEAAIHEPQVTFEKTYTVLIDMMRDGCGVTGAARFDPPFPAAGLRLNVGDSYEITVKNIADSTVVANWVGEWYWTEECGKNGNDTCPQKKPAVGSSSVIFGQNYKVFASTGEEPVQLSKNPLKRFAEKLETLRISASTGTFPTPENPRPHPRATESIPLCASVAANPAHIADMTVRVVSRFQ